MLESKSHGYSAEQIEWQLNPAVSIPNQNELNALSQKRAAEYRKGVKNVVYNVSYGARARETLDIFLPDKPSKAPVEIFIHGGYWRRREKEGYSYLAEQITKAGGISIIAEYELCPNVTLDEIVCEMRLCCAWVYDHISEYGGDPNRIHLCGNSAGGHLVAMMLATDFTAVSPSLPRDIVKGAVPISGIYDCRPVIDISMNKEIGLDQEMARRNSPVFLRPVARCPIVVAVGGAETDEFRRQSRALVDVWKSFGRNIEYLEAPGANHVTVVSETDTRGHPLMEARLRLMGIG